MPQFFPSLGPTQQPGQLVYGTFFRNLKIIIVLTISLFYVKLRVVKEGQMKSREIDLTDFDDVESYLAQVLANTSFSSTDALDKEEDAVAAAIVNQELEYYAASIQLLRQYIQTNNRGQIKALMTILTKKKGMVFDQIVTMINEYGKPTKIPQQATT
jgi:hypothetical protein